MTKSQDKYRTICQENYIPWYASDWWLDTVCGPENWDAIYAEDTKGQVIGAMPMAKRKIAGFTLHLQPTFTACLHIYIKAPTSVRAVYQNNREQRILLDLAKQIPKTPLFDHQFDEYLQNLLPFHWQGFQNTVRYTYQFPDLSDITEIHRQMESSARNHIRKAKDLLEVKPEAKTAALLDLVQESMDRKNIAFQLKPDQFEAISLAIQQHANMQIYAAYDKDEKPQAAIAIIQDEKRASFWLSGSSESGRKSGAIYLLLWTAIKDAAKKELLFDFEGSMAPSVEAVFRSFGATRTPYYRIKRARPGFLSLLRK